MRLKPYTRKGEKRQELKSKFKTGEFPDKDSKLEVRNANRSLKKAYRAELKKELQRQLDNINKDEKRDI